LHILKNIVHSGRMPDSPPNVPAGETSPNRGVMIVLAYLWLLALVPLMLEKQDHEVQWHAKHGIVLMIAELVVLLLYMMVTSIISMAALPIGCVLSLFLVFAWVGVLAMHVVAIIKGINGDRLMIPGVSEYASRQIPGTGSARSR